jgi:hypothetical protein
LVPLRLFGYFLGGQKVTWTFRMTYKIKLKLLFNRNFHKQVEEQMLTNSQLYN